MASHDMRELSVGELETVSGGLDNYKFCWNGPAGEGMYPNYVDCGGPTLTDIINGIVENVNQIVKNGGRPK